MRALVMGVLALGVSVLADPSICTGAGPIDWQPEFVPMGKGPAFYPRVAELAGGALLCGFDHADGGQKVIDVVRSLDGGTTWSAFSRVAQYPATDDVANAFPLQLADGTVLVAFRRNSPKQKLYRIEVYATADRGKSWSFRGAPAVGSTGLWEPFLLELPDKTLQVYYASEEGIAPDQRIEMRASRDSGRTWSTAVTVARRPGARDGMPGVVRFPDGTLFAVFETNDLPPFRFVIRSVRSRDNGATWTPTRDLIYKPSNAHGGPWSAGAPSADRLSDGRLLVSFQTDEDMIYRNENPLSDPAAHGYDYTRHTSFKYVMTAKDAGGPWNAPVKLAGSPGDPAVWNALYVTRSGRVLALAGFHAQIWCRIGDVKE